MAALVFDSYLVTPIGISDTEHEICKEILVAALQAPSDTRKATLESAIDIIIYMRLDGLIENLTTQYLQKKSPQLKRSTALRAENILLQFMREAHDKLYALLSVGIPSAIVWFDGHMGDALFYIWSLYDAADDRLSVIFEAVSVSETLAIEKKKPPHDLA